MEPSTIKRIFMSPEVKIAVVTGPGGLTGTYLIEALLQKEYKVRLLVRTEKAKKEILNFLNERDFINNIDDKVEFCYGDICNFKDVNSLIENADYVFHNAAFVSFNPNKKDKIFKVNVLGTQNVVNALIENKNCKLIHFSSIATLGASAKSNMINEQCVHYENNDNPYSLSKYYAELEVWRGIEEGIKAVIINPGIILGYSKTGRSSSVLLIQMAQGMSFVPAGITGYVDVEDVCRAAILLAEKEIMNKRFILCAENMSYIELFNIVRETVHSKVKPHLINKRLILILAYIIQFFAGIFNKEPIIAPPMIKSSFTKKFYDGSAICGIAGFEYTSISKTLDKWYQQMKN